MQRNRYSRWISVIRFSVINLSFGESSPPAVCSEFVAGINGPPGPIPVSTGQSPHHVQRFHYKARAFRGSLRAMRKSPDVAPTREFSMYYCWFAVLCLLLIPISA